MSAISPPAPYATPGGGTDDDDDFDYVWSRGGVDLPVPRWLGELLDVPFAVRLELVLIGVCIGLVIAAVAVVVGFYSAF